MNAFEGKNSLHNKPTNLEKKRVQITGTQHLIPVCVAATFMKSLSMMSPQ